MQYIKTVCACISSHNRSHLVNYTFTVWYGDSHTYTQTQYIFTGGWNGVVDILTCYELESLRF